MIKSLKKVLFTAVAAAALFSGCSEIATDDFAENSASDSSRSVSVTASNFTLKSDLNPGYGYAVYFTGTFDEGKNWTVAVRGSYDNGWSADVTASESFEWKALTGSYDLGETVSDFSSLTWENSSNHSVEYSDPTIPANKFVITIGGLNRYGQTLYFAGSFDEGNNWSTAVQGSYNSYEYKYYAVVSASSKNFEWKALRGFGSFGDTVSLPCNSLTWDSGENNTTVYNMKEYMETLHSPSCYGYFDTNASEYRVYFNKFENEFAQYLSGTKVELYRGTEKVYETVLASDSTGGLIPYSPAKNDLLPYYAVVTPVNVWGTEGASTKTTAVTPAMNLVKHDDFTMGSDSDSYTDNAAHYVFLSKDYYMAKYEVTQGQFVELFGFNPVDVADKVYSRGDNYPAFYVSWIYAIAFCNKLSIAAGYDQVYSVDGVDFETVTFDQLRRLSDFTAWKNVSVNTAANGYRLPTEAEWEYAARANGMHTTRANETASSGTTPAVMEIGLTDPNNWGFYDLTGNVAEYVWDSYAAFTSDDATDPTGPAQSENKVIRGGGAWLNYNLDLLYRTSVKLNNGPADVGFRVVRNVQ